jgi:hypothetical protein
MITKVIPTAIMPMVEAEIRIFRMLESEKNARGRKRPKMMKSNTTLV